MNLPFHSVIRFLNNGKVNILKLAVTDDGGLDPTESKNAGSKVTCLKK